MLIVAAVIAVPYMVYALDYAGHYNVQVQFTANKDSAGVFSVSSVGFLSEPTEAWDFWDIMKGHSGGGDKGYGYQVYCEVSRGGSLIGFAVTMMLLENSESADQTITVMNLAPGEASFRLYIVDLLTETTVYDRTFVEAIP